MFTLREVSKAYAGRPALGPLSLVVPAGQTTMRIGPSGCRNSTLLRLLIGLIGLIGLVEPDAGTVTFDGGAVLPTTARAVRCGSGTSYVIQDGGLFPHLTARDSHADGPPPRPRPRFDHRAGERTRGSDPLSGRRSRPILHQLFGGLRQRVGLMRALMLDPDTLLLDEPLGALDPLVRADLQAEMRDIFRTLGKTVVLVTHDLGEAAYFADHVALLRHRTVFPHTLSSTCAVFRRPEGSMAE
jgi:osmoprotectant transport system ATP-binding protein